MSKLTTYEGIVQNGRVTLPPEADIPDNTPVYVLVPSSDKRTYKILSPRLADPEQARDFLKLEVIDESNDAGV
jgi:hypothetical protein